MLRKEKTTEANKHRTEVHYDYTLFRHGLVREHLVWIGVAKLTMTISVSDIAMKLMNDCNVDDCNDEVPHPGDVQLLHLQVPAFLATASGNALAAVGTVSSGLCNVSNGRQNELVSTIPVA